jgi:uncharacterized membrane protein
MQIMSLAIALHVLAAVLWVGGMFFAHQVLRPAVGPLDPPVRLPLWGRVFPRFFAWVWVSIIVLLSTGYWMVFGTHGGFARLPIPYHVMNGIGWLMMGIFLYLWFVPYARFRRALGTGDLPSAGKALNRIRQIVGINLILGLINVAIGAGGRYLG